MSDNATSHRAAEHCQTCGVLVGTPRGLAEYHPYEFCRVFKAGGDPWLGLTGKMERLDLNEVDEVLKAALQENCRRFWRERHHTEITLP